MRKSILSFSSTCCQLSRSSSILSAKAKFIFVPLFYPVPLLVCCFVPLVCELWILDVHCFCAIV